MSAKHVELKIMIGGTPNKKTALQAAESRIQESESRMF